MTTSASRVARAHRRRQGTDDSVAMAHLQGLLGLFHAVYWLHWTTHWQTNGDPFYGDHQLFAKLYEAMPEEIDVLAEKLVQMYGREAVAVEHHLPLVGRWLSGWRDTDPVGRCLAAERELQGALKQTYDALKASGTISLGLDDFLMSVANDHETHLYLLQQRMGGIMSLEGKVASGAPSAEGHFFDAPKKREVREFAESKAVTNDPVVAEGAIESKELDQTARTVRKEVDRAPLTVSEVLDLPGGSQFGTLNRYVVETEHPGEVLAPRPHPRILSR